MFKIVICLALTLLFNEHMVSSSSTSDEASNLPKLYYINLDRRPDRREFMENQFIKENVKESFNIIRFPAIDGATTKIPDAALSMFANADFKDNYNFKPLVANQLSHYTLWMRIFEDTDQEYALILQDDAFLKTDFNKEVQDVIDNMPQDTAVIWLGMHGFADRSFSIPMMIESDYDPNEFSEPIENNPYVGHATRNACSLAYIITRKGVEDLMAYFNKFGFYRATDRVMNDALTSYKKNYISRKVLCTGDVAFISDSDVFGENDRPSTAPLHKENFLNMLKAQAYADSLGVDLKTLQEMVGKQQAAVKTDL